MRKFLNKLKQKNNSIINYLLILLIVLTSCKGAGGKFEGLDASSDEKSISPITVSISSVTPAVNPVSLASDSVTTFGVTLLETNASVNYTFLLDNTTTLQSGSNSLYDIDASTLTSGSHTLKVTASNSTSSDSHIFNIIVNSPTIISSFTPTLTGSSLACGIGSQNLSALYSELNTSDTVNIKWYLNNTLVSFGNSTATVTNDPGNNVALLNYHPDCTQTGINFIRLDLFDGTETTSMTWTIYVTAPISIAISDKIPLTDPTIITNANTTTFGVTLTTPDPTARFQFVLDNAITVQNDQRAYYSLAGTSLTTGNHTLKVTASNANSSAVHTFNVRKNAPAAVEAFSPAYSGTTLNCGAAPVTLYADLNDPNGDTLTYQWLVDDAPSAYISPSNSGNRAQASFTPNCAIAGTRVVKAVVSDGFESTTVTWSINIVSPITVVITSFLPATNPTVIKNNQTTTFVVALSASDSNVTYSFSLKNLTTLVTTSLQSGTIPFYNLIGSNIAAGLYELKVTASNGSSSDTKTFTVRKNSMPDVPPSPQVATPALTGVTLDCGSSSQVFNSAIFDADGDIMSVTWYLDGVANAANLISTSTSSLARATYTPSCAEVGIKNIRVDVYDGYEITSKTWTVAVVNPTVVSINAYSPSTDPVNVLSTGAQTFTVSATGKAPLAYQWKLDGNIISASTGAFTTINAASLTTGVHVLTCRVYDSDSEQTRTFNIIKNAPPVLANKTPANQTPKINVNTVINFSANYTDANNDGMTVTWKINNSNVGANHPNASIVTNSSLTTLTFSPNASVIGDNTIELIVGDGKETTSWLWTVNVNYFSDVCNTMGSGKACTIIGRPGMGSGINPITSPEKVRVQPMFIAPFGSNGSYFFSDPNTHTVWFHNRGASTENILGQSIGAGKLQVVAGLGMCGTGTSGTFYNDFPLCNPRGVAWDSVNGRLFISDESNARVVVVTSDGVVTHAFGGGSNNTAGNQDNQVATSSRCGTPRGLAFNPSGSLLYVSCQADGTIKAVNTSSATISAWTASILVGRASGGATGNGFVDGTNGFAGTAQINQPMQLKLDTDNNILYATSNGDCRLRAINLTASARTNYYFGAITLPASSTTTVIGAGCAGYTMGAYSAVRYNGGWLGVELQKTGSTLNGIFFSDYNSHRISFINNTASSITLGNVAVPSYQAATIWGNPSGTAGYYVPCSAASDTTCYVNNPSTLWRDGNFLYLADYSNFRVRRLDVSTTNGAVTDLIGFDSKRGYAGNGGTSSENVQFNTPLNLYYDSASNKLIISDFANFRFRSLNLVTGRMDSFISNGAGDANNSNADPTVLGTRGPRGVVNYQNHFIYSDNQNNNCVLRAWNTYTTNQNILGVLTNANAVQTIAGNWANGCGAWNATAITGTHSTARLNQPQGVTTDGTNLYFANTNAHCIIKVDSTGAMSTLSGLCGTSGTANAAGAAFGNTALVKYNLPTAVVADPRPPYTTSGNLFILDQTTTAQSRIRYLNQYSTAVTIYGVTINPGEIRTVYAAPDSHGADLAAFDVMICYSSGGNYNYISNGNSSSANNNVICINRDDNTGTNYSRFGRNPSSYIGRGAQQNDQEEEGIPGTGITLAGPAGLAFDSQGNLFIAEREAHVIRLIKRWW